MSPNSRLGDLERAVMERLWHSDTDDWTSVRQVHEALASERTIAYTTVMTVLQRLARKSLVEERRDGRAYLYRASSSRGVLSAELMRQTLDDHSSEDRRAALVRFVGQASPEEVAALREALADLDD